MDAPFFDHHGAGGYWTLKAASAQDLENAVAVNGPAQCALDRDVVGLQRLGALDSCSFFHEDRISRDPSRARFLHVQANFALAAQVATEGAFYAR